MARTDDIDAPKPFKRSDDAWYTLVLTICVVAVILAVAYGIIVAVNASRSPHNLSQAATFAKTLPAPAGCHETHRAESTNPGDSTTPGVDVLTINYDCNNILGSTLYGELMNNIKSANYGVSQDYSISPDDGQYSYAIGFDNNTTGGLYSVAKSATPDQTALGQQHYNSLTLTISPLALKQASAS